MAGKVALQRTQSQPSSKNAADRVTKRLVHSARSGARQGSSIHPPVGTSIPAAAAAASSSASEAAASALKQASVSGRLGCPKCRQAVYGCKKCRTAYVRTTGISIPIDRSLHVDVFSMLQHPLASSHPPAKPNQLVLGQKASPAGLVNGDKKGKAVCPGRGKATPAAMHKEQKSVADGQRLPAKGQKLSDDRETLSADRRGSAKLTEATVQQPARKKQKVATSAATAAADTDPRTSNRAASGSKRPPPDSSPDVKKAHAASAPPAAKRSRLSQTPKAPPAAQAPDPCHSTAIKVSSPKLSTAGRAATASGGKPSSNAKSATRAAKPSSSSARTGSATAKQLSKAVKAPASAPAAVAGSVAAPLAAEKPRPVALRKHTALPKQAAWASKDNGKPTSVPPKSHTKGSGPGLKASSASPAPALPTQTAARARSVAAPKAMPAAKLRQTPSSRAAVAAGSLLVQNLDSNLGCSKCRFVPTGCKRCKAKQAGQQQQQLGN